MGAKEKAGEFRRTGEDRMGGQPSSVDRGEGGLGKV